MIPCLMVFGFLNFLGAQAAFQFAGKNKVYLIDGSSTSVDVTYTSGHPNNLTAVVNADTDITINGTINHSHKNGTVEISSSGLGGLGYGTYKMVLDLTGNGVQENITAALFFEKNLTGLQVNSPVVETLVNTDTLLSASLLSGSGTTVEWISSETSFVTYGKCQGSVGTIEGTMTFSSTQNYTVTLLSINSLGQGLSDQATVIVLNPIEGFSITKSPSVVAVKEDMTFSLLLDSLSRLPMGNIYTNVSYGDGTEENTKYLNNMNTLLSPGYQTKHKYTKQGNYTVTCRLYTSVSQKSVYVVALVWNAITLPSAVSYIEVGKTGIFYDDYVSNTPFHYYITYGDNRTVHSPLNIVVDDQPINTTAWDTSYDTAGVYQIELEGWNSVYYRNCKYEVRVQNPIPELELFPKETNPLTPFAALNAGVDFTLTLKDINSLPPTNMSCKFCFDSGSDCSGDIDIVLEGSGSYTINHVYTVGIKSISVNCSNEISYRITETRIDVIPGIEGFNVTNGYILTLMVNNSTTSEFKYTQGTMLSVSMVVYAQETINISGIVDNSNKIGHVTLTENDIPNVHFGQYKVTLELKSAAGEVHVITLALLYDEPIEGFLVEEETDLILTEDPTKFYITFTKGSNMEIEIVVNEAESILLACNGTVRQTDADYLYMHAINYNVTSVARNSISNAESPYQIVTAVQRVKGFDITTDDNLIDSKYFAQFKITLDSSSRLPMHDLTLYLSYGDNDNSGLISFDDVKTSASLSTNGYPMSHQYLGQGNFSIIGYIRSNLSSLPLVLDIYVWDNITNVRLQSNTSARVDEEISFYFLNVPNSGFEYQIDFGDGASNTSSPNIVMFDYVDTTFIHSYSAPDVYEVRARMWNPFFVVEHSYLIIVQHPIVDYYLSPRPPIQYPIPDGKVKFKINMTTNNPDPTNVTCQFSYENGIVKSNDSVTITYTKSEKRTHKYKTDGTKSIEILCTNIVSGVLLTTEVEIKAVELDNFTFVYEHVVPMNMTPNATDIPVEVPFLIRLFECVKFPPTVNFTWNYGDGSGLEVIEIDNVLHIYELRKIYPITVVIKNSTAETTKTMTIKLGAVDFNVSSYLAGIGITTIVFQMTGIGLNGDYELYPELPNFPAVVQTKKQLQENAVVKFNKIYMKYGMFFPKIIAINENFTEYLYFPQPMVADYNMSVMVIDMQSTLRMPDPGKMNVTAALSSGTAIPLPETSCTYDMQDFINFTVVNLKQNITADEPLIFTFSYLTLGAHDVTVNCSNFYDKFMHKDVVEVTNKCFTIEGIFDRQYARPTSPMRVYTTENFDLTNRMGVHCSNESVKFNWKINRYYSEHNKEEVFKHDNDPSQESRGSYRFSKGKVPAGLYEVNLNVSLLTTWIPERTYLLFVQPPPVAFIEGGYQRTSKLSSTYSTIDALKSSYDVAIGYGGNGNLNFTWTCYATPAVNLDDLAQKYERQTYSATPCSIPEVSRGIGNLTLEREQGYIITVNVSLDIVFADYTQLIMVVDGNFPDIYIRCILNCDIKYAVTAKSIWEVVCIDCVGKPTYKWDLEVQNGTGHWSDAVDSQSSTGVLQKHFDILEYALQENTWYRITVNVTDNYGVGTAKWKFITNLRPYGGCCKAVNESVKGRPPKADEVIQEDMPSGKAFSTQFAIYCFDWKDEGDRHERDEQADSRQMIPLMYEYVMKQYFNSSTSQDLSRETSIYKGGESTARDLRLPAGNPENDYIITLYVKIIDRFGDYAMVNWTVNVTKDEDFEPSDTAGANRLFDVYDDNSNTTKAGGNGISLLRLIASTASMYRSTQMGNKTTTNADTAVDITYYEEETSDELETIIKEKTKEFINEIAALVPPNSTITVLPADAQLVASTLDECISNKDAITLTSSEGVTNTTYELMLNVQSISAANPYPMSELGAIQGATRDVVDVLSKNLHFYDDFTIEDTNVTLTLAIVEEDLRTYLLYHPEDFEKYPIIPETIQKLFDKRTAIREKQKDAGSTTEKTTDKLFGTIDTVNDVNSRLVAYGQGANVVKVDNLYLSIEKDSVGNFLNKSRLERNGINIDFENETFTNVTAENLDIQVSVLDKSPLIHAKGASKIHENIVKFTVRDDNNNEVKIPLKMTIKNNGKTYYTTFDSSIFADEQNGLMHFRCQLQDTNDAIIVYFLPDGFDETTTETYNLTLYGTSQITSVVGQYEFEELISPLSWTHYGFKIFIPSRTFPAGDVILSLKAQEAPPNNTESGGLSRRKRSTSNLSSPTANNLTLANISVAVVTTGCRAYDDGTQSWTPNGCVVLPHSTINDTVCNCPPTAGTIFASSFFVPNLIDFHSVWSKFDANNAAVYGTLIAVFVLYILGVVILRRYDRMDKLKWLPMLLCDNKKSDNYFYLISVFTGLRPGSGTTSNISFILGGEDTDSGVRLLSDGKTKGLESKTVKSFVMATPKCLGGLTYIRVWHDSSGEGNDASWYLHKVVIDDLQNKERFVFLCDRWLALDLDDGMVDRLCPVVDKDNAGFEVLFSEQTRSNVTDNHLWLSIVVRPQRSLFTRVQRISCLLSLLLLTMITNAMFFQSSDEETITPDSVRIGSLRLSLRSLYISVVGILITVPPIMVMTYLFKNSKTRKTVKKEAKSKDNESKLEPISEEEENENKPIKEAKDVSQDIVMEEQAKYPHWVVYIAWVVVVLSVIVPAFFMILYSMQWGKDKSEEWLTTFVLSFVESLFIVDPMKVLIIALLIAWLIKKPGEDVNYNIDLNSVRDKCQSCAENNSNQFTSFRMEIMSKSGPPVEDALEGQRMQRLKEKIAQAAFIDLVLQILFAVVVFSISYVNRDERAYYLKKNIDDHLFHSTKTHYGFSKVNSKHTFFNWTKEILIPFTYPEKHFDGKTLGAQYAFFVADLSNLRVGMVRLRQVRGNDDNCVYSALTDDHYCVPKYATDRENKSAMIPPATLLYSAGAWTHTSAESIWGIPIRGLYNTYGGGGYIQTFHSQKVTSLNTITELEHNRWIDRHTRAVFVEFSLYNPNINLYSYSIYLAEFSEIGGTFHWADTQCFRASTITDATGAFAIIFYVIFLIIIIVITVKLVNKFRRDGCCKTSTNLWNVLDIVLCFFSYTGCVVWVCKYIYTRSAMDRYYENRNEFINFQHIVVWEYIFTCILGVLCFASTLRILSALGYNKRLTEVAAVLRHGAKPILQFAVVFMCVFFNFVGFGYLLFGSTVYEYRNMFISFGSLTNTLIGRNSLDSMIRAAPNFAELYFFVYVFFVIFTLMTMFAAILNDSISEVRNNQADDTIGIIHIVKSVVKDILGVAGIHIRNETSRRMMEKYKVKDGRTNSIDTNKIMGLIRETLEDFKFQEKGKDKNGEMSQNDEIETEKPQRSKTPFAESRPATACNVKIVLPDGKEVRDNDDFYDFYKTYI